LFRKLLSFEEAKKAIELQIISKPLGGEDVPLLESTGRVLAEDVVADRDIPPFNRSTVDGYAVRAEDTYGAEEVKPIRLRLSGTVNIGRLPRTSVKKSQVAEIVTGAPLPGGANAVVMMEHTNQKDCNVLVYKAVAEGENVMKAGSDLEKGKTVLRQQQILSSRKIGVLAALGKAKIKVYEVPKVAVLSTGAEITEPGRKLGAGKIFDINGYTLSAAAFESGGKPAYLGVFPDNEDELHRVLVQALATSDLIVTSGGASVGPKDIMPKTLDGLGSPGVFLSGVAIKPGKPMSAASVSGKPVFSLPGHPTSALLTFMLFVRPLIRAMGGRRPEKFLEVKAFASVRMFSAKGRRTFIMVKLKRGKTEGLEAEPITSGLSGAIATLATAEGFIEIAENIQFVDAGEVVTVKLFKTEDDFEAN
jgi:molybdenum cofactor synthesis domain-containing protein